MFKARKKNAQQSMLNAQFSMLKERKKKAQQSILNAQSILNSQ